jgi:hypothetical protein
LEGDWQKLGDPTGSWEIVLVQPLSSPYSEKRVRMSSKVLEAKGGHNEGQIKQDFL